MSITEGLNAIVTGGTRGIGRAVVLALAKEGVNIAFCSRTESEVVDFRAELCALFPALKIYGAVCDISCAESTAAFVHAAMQNLGGLDIVVNNAGLGVFGSFGAIDSESWEKVMSVNANGTFNMCKQAVPVLLANEKSPKGCVINIGSSSPEKYVPGNVAYASSKAAIKTFTEYLFNEYRKDDLNITYVSVGSVNTTLSKRNPDTIGWKIKPEEVGEIVRSVVTLAYATSNACIDRISIRTKKPIEYIADKE